MGYRDRRQPASYAGVNIVIDTINITAGHKTTISDYVQQDGGSIASLGLKQRRITAEFRTFEPDYDRDMMEIERALQKSQPQQFIHPSRGALVVLATNWTVREQVGTGAGSESTARFSVEFVEHNRTAEPESSPAPRRRSLQAGAAIEAIRARMAAASGDILVAAIEAITDDILTLEQVENDGLSSVPISPQLLEQTSLLLETAPSDAAVARGTLTDTLISVLEIAFLERTGIRQILDLSDAMIASAQATVTNRVRLPEFINRERVALEAVIASIIVVAAIVLARTSDNAETQSQAVEGAVRVSDMQTLLEETVASGEHETEMAQLDLQYTGEQEMIENVGIVVAQAAEILQTRAIMLPSAGAVELEHPQTIITLLATEFGTVDETRIDEILTRNSIRDERIFMLPAGLQLAT